MKFRYVTFFDTETTGFVNFKAPNNSPLQCHLVQLAMILWDFERDVPVKKISTLVDVGIEIPESARKAHGITNEMTRQFGIQPKTAAAMFNHFRYRSDMMVAHNKEFDKKVMAVECARHLGVDDIWHGTPVFCTMKATKDIVKLPPSEKMVKAGMGGFKVPKLSEAYMYFFGEELVGAHDALVDTEACMRVFRELMKMGIPMEDLR